MTSKPSPSPMNRKCFVSECDLKDVEMTPDEAADHLRGHNDAAEAARRLSRVYTIVDRLHLDRGNW